MADNNKIIINNNYKLKKAFYKKEIPNTINEIQSNSLNNDNTNKQPQEPTDNITD